MLFRQTARSEESASRASAGRTIKASNAIVPRTATNSVKVKALAGALFKRPFWRCIKDFLSGFRCVGVILAATAVENKLSLSAINAVLWLNANLLHCSPRNPGKKHKAGK